MAESSINSCWKNFPSQPKSSMNTHELPSPLVVVEGCVSVCYPGKLIKESFQPGLPRGDCGSVVFPAASSFVWAGHNNQPASAAK